MERAASSSPLHSGVQTPTSGAKFLRQGESSMSGKTQAINPVNGVRIPALPPLCFFYNSKRSKQPSTDGTFFKEQKSIYSLKQLLPGSCFLLVNVFK